jgi:hypothetical protein
MIVSSALKLPSGDIIVGLRHGDCYWMMKHLGYSIKESQQGIQGFITEKGIFMDREEAYYEALKYNQCKLQTYDKEYMDKCLESNNGLYISEADYHPELFSEDVW